MPSFLLFLLAAFFAAESSTNAVKVTDFKANEIFAQSVETKETVRLRKGDIDFGADGIDGLREANIILIELDGKAYKVRAIDVVTPQYVQSTPCLGPMASDNTSIAGAQMGSGQRKC